MYNYLHNSEREIIVYGNYKKRYEIDFKLVYASYWTDDNYYEYLKKKSIKCAEVLIPYEIPYDYVICAAVVNERAEQRLEQVGFDKAIMIEPRLFF